MSSESVFQLGTRLKRKKKTKDLTNHHFIFTKSVLLALGQLEKEIVLATK